MRYIVLFLVTLCAPAQSMERIKEKWTNFYEHVNFSGISNRVSKDACLEKLSSLSRFLNSGLNHLVELTVRNDNYTTKEKAIIGAGSVGAVVSIIGAKYVLKKSRLTKIPAPEKNKIHSTLGHWTGYDAKSGEWVKNSSDLTLEKDDTNKQSIRALEYNHAIKRAVNGALNHIASDKTVCDQKIKDLDLLIADENPMRESLTHAAQYLLEEKVVLAKELEKNLELNWKTAVETVLIPLQKEMRDLDSLSKSLKTKHSNDPKQNQA